MDIFYGLNFTTDIIILVTIAAFILAGVMLGQQRVKVFALSVYVGLVMASELGGVVYGFLAGSLNNYTYLFNESGVKLALLALPIVLLELGNKHIGHSKKHGNFLGTMILSVLVSLLVVSSALHLFEGGMRDQTVAGSTLAWMVYSLRLWWIGLVPVAFLAQGLFKHREN